MSDSDDVELFSENDDNEIEKLFSGDEELSDQVMIRLMSP
jgi:hypothetical protein